ncbi:MAG: rhodanese-like domain-containing protein [Betaproteobacteria bacterium]
MNQIITRETLLEKLGSDTPPLLLEALPEKYYTAQHLPGARLMPHDAVAALAPRLIPSPDAEVVVYCASPQCRNSHIAARHLAQLGYRRVSVYAGGKQDWAAGGLPFETPEPIDA